MNRINYMAILLLLMGVMLPVQEMIGCTSMIVSGRVSASGKPLLWKHRDTGTEHNFVERVSRPGEYAYVALFNGGDSLLREAWMGMNDRGFAIMNTASYNLAPDTAKVKDREGIVMSRALAVCRTVEDFSTLLDTLPKPLGVQANFGVIDAEGDGAYFETDDYTYKIYKLQDSETGVLIRTNFSLSGNDTDGMGYIRYDNARYLTQQAVAGHSLTPAHFTELCSRSFYHSMLEKDCAWDTTVRWVVDQDFIPRYSSSASIVIEGCLPGEFDNNYIMWTTLGYPPVSHVEKVTIDEVPRALRPTAEGWRAPACNNAIEFKRKAFPVQRGSGKRYIDMDYLRAKSNDECDLSLKNYKMHYQINKSVQNK